MFVILFQWLLALIKGATTDDELPSITLTYNNMCNLERLKVAKMPLDPPFDKIWLNVTKVCSTFKTTWTHYARELYSSARLKAENPDFNTQAGEQTFLWLCKLKHIVCAMNKTHHLFYIHRMVLLRAKLGRKPILPKSRN